MADTPRLRIVTRALAALLLTGVVTAQIASQMTPLFPPPTTPTVTRPVPEPPIAPTVTPLVPQPLITPPVTAASLPKIVAGTPLKDLLPAAPKTAKTAVYTGDDLRRVPELRFEAAPEKELTTEQWNKRKAHTAAAALHLNAKEEDGFLKAMVKERTDFAGVPFAMGGACRTKRPRAAAFKMAGQQLLNNNPPHALAQAVSSRIIAPSAAEDEEDFRLAQMDAVRQKMGPGDEPTRRATVKYFASVPRPEASRELARMAVFSTHEAVRKEALKALSIRRERDYSSVLVEALRYPWPAVARNAAEAIVKLDRKDLMPNLVEMLETADPRGPVAEGKKTTARELVRVNHHSNCMMCHAPAERGKVAEDILVAEVPVPTEPLTPPTQGYGNTGSNLLVRIDVTYLRQDFSVLQAVDAKGPWPAMQRFDFVVRKRELTTAEADELRDLLEKREPGVLSPYQKAAVNALREMTGRDFEAKAEPWRRHLKLKGS